MKNIALTFMLFSFSALACEVGVLYTQPEGCKLVTELKAESINSKQSAIEELQHKAFDIYANTLFLKEITPTEVTVHDIKEPVATHYKIKAEAYDCRSHNKAQQNDLR